MALKKTLLQKAKNIPTQRHTVKITPEMEEAALAWCRGEVSVTQIARAMDLDNTGYRMYAMIAHALKNYINKNFKN